MSIERTSEDVERFHSDMKRIHERMSNRIDDFITHELTRDMSEYLRGERESEIRECHECVEHYDELQREYDEYWSTHCQEHGTEMTDGYCALCVQEERRNDL